MNISNRSKVRVGPVLGLVLASLLWANGATPPLRSTYYGGLPADRVSFGNNLKLDASVAMSVEAWIYREDQDRCETILSRDYKVSYWFGVCGGHLRFYRSGAKFADSDVAIGERNWTHVAATYDGATVRFYVDGQPAGVKTLANAGANLAGTLWLGGDNAGYDFFGYVDEVRIWSGVRSEAQIRNNRFRELSGTEAGLVLYAPQGGTEDRGRVFGILPRELTIPTAPVTTVTVDGRVDPASEYAGAEQLVICYGNRSGVPDAVAYLVYRNYAGNPLLGIPADRNLFVGVKQIRTTTGAWPLKDSWIALHFDPDRSRDPLAQTNDFQVQLPLDDGTPFADPAPRWLWGNATGSYRAERTPVATRWDTAIAYARTEFDPPDMEFRLDGIFFGNFAQPVGLMAGHFWVGGVGNDFLGPSDAGWNAPVTWTTATFGSSEVQLPLVQVGGRVLDGLARTPVAGHPVMLIEKTSGTVIAEQLTQPDGSFAFRQLVAPDRALEVRVEECIQCLYLTNLVASGSGVAPTNLAPWHVTYPGCASGECTYRSVDYVLRKPIPSVSLTSFEPRDGNPALVVDNAPRRTRFPTQVTIRGNHLHPQIRVYLYDCAEFPPGLLCAEGEGYFEAPIIERASDETFVKVLVPDIPRSRWPGLKRWVVQDLWNRAGAIEWTAIGDSVNGFFVHEPSYPKMWGFPFRNEFWDPGIEEFLSVFGFNAFLNPEAPFPIPDPGYFILMLAAYEGIMGSVNGSCYGMAATSQLFTLGERDMATFESDVVRPVGFTGVETRQIPRDFGPLRATSEAGGLEVRANVPFFENFMRGGLLRFQDGPEARISEVRSNTLVRLETALATPVTDRPFVVEGLFNVTSGTVTASVDANSVDLRTDDGRAFFDSSVSGVRLRFDGGWDAVIESFVDPTHVRLRPDTAPPVDLVRQGFRTLAWNVPPFPPSWSGFGPATAPANLGALIRRNHGVQLSQEPLSEVLAQLVGYRLDDESPIPSSISGDPRAVLRRLRSDPTRYVLSVIKELGKGHAVTPYRVEPQTPVGPAEDVTASRHWSILVYDNNWPEDTNCVVWIDTLLNQYEYLKRPGSTDPDDLWTGRGIFATPVSTWSRSLHLPAFRDNLDRLACLVFGDADGYYTDAEANAWGWKPDGSIVDALPGAKSITPLGAPGDATRNVFLFPAPEHPVTDVALNVRGSSFGFYAAQHGALFQVLNHGGKAGATDHLRLRNGTTSLEGLEYESATANNQIEFQAAVYLSNSRVVLYRVKPEQLPAVRPLELLADRATGAISLRDDAAGAPVAYTLDIHVADADLDLEQQGTFTGLRLLPGTRQRFQVQSDGDTQRVVSLIDVDDDGSPEQTWFLGTVKGGPQPEPPTLTASRLPNAIRLAWPAAPLPLVLESAGDLEPNAAWTNAGDGTVEGASVTMDLPVDQGARYFRLRSVP